MDAKPKKWIKSAVAHKGALHRHLGIPAGEKIPVARLHEAARSKDKEIRAEANLALTLEGLRHGGEKQKPRRSVKDARAALYGEK